MGPPAGTLPGSNLNGTARVSRADEGGAAMSGYWAGSNRRNTTNQAVKFSALPPVTSR